MGSIDGPVNWLNRILALVLVTLWVPITSHCPLESLPGLGFLQCASGTPSDNDCSEDACQALESGAYKVESNRTVVPPTVLCVAWLGWLPVVTDSPGGASGQGESTSAPPELSQTWQFSFRTASSPRAPSFAS